jgi:hypothetical protein
MGAYVENVSDQFTWSNWLELLDDTSRSSSSLTTDTQESKLIGLIPWNMQRSATQFFLGYAYTDTGSPWRLHRVNPQPHPIFPWLYASSISFTPFVPKPNSQLSPQRCKFPSPFYPTLFTSYYQYVIATVTFHAFRMNFLPDSAITTNVNEYMRNVYIDTEPKIEALSVDAISQLLWQETSGGSGPIVGNPIPAPVPQLQAKTGFTLNWTNVPWSYLSTDNTFFFPTKIIACAGTLNSTTFLGNPSFTLYLDAPHFRIKPFPVANAVIGTPLYGVDVMLPLLYFNPENTYSGSSTQGFVVFPWRGDGKYYHAARASGDEVLPATNFGAIFSNVNDSTMP